MNEEGLEDDEMVPTLQEIVALDDDPNSATSESAPTQTHQTEIEESTITNAKPLAPLPGQQSLFGDGDVTEDKTEPHTPSNKQPNKKARKYENKQQNSEEMIIMKVVLNSFINSQIAVCFFPILEDHVYPLLQ